MDDTDTSRISEVDTSRDTEYLEERSKQYKGEYDDGDEYEDEVIEDIVDARGLYRALMTYK